jgi:hypothetical protein
MDFGTRPPRPRDRLIETIGAGVLLLCVLPASLGVWAVALSAA